MKYCILRILFLIPVFSDLDAQSVQQLIEKGNAAYDAQSFRAAQDFYKEAASKDPAHQFPESLFNLGNALFQQHQYNEAAQQFLVLTKLNVSTTVKALAFYNLGNCYLQQKNYESSIVAFKQTLRLNPRDDDARYNLSFASAIISRQSGSSSEKNKQEQKEQRQEKPLTNLTPEEMKKMLDDLNNLESKTLDKKEKQRPRKSEGDKDW